MKSSIRPLFDRVIVCRKEVETTTPGGLFIPNKAQEKANTGVVMAVGKGRRLANGSFAKMSVKVGDIIMFGKYSGNEIKYGGEDYLILQESDIIGIVEE